MATNDYGFMTRWRVRGTAAEVYDLVVDAQGYVRWWPHSFLLKPLFSANHSWAMAKGREGLQKELAASAAW